MLPEAVRAGIVAMVPVILARGDEAGWLGPAVEDSAKLLPMLQSYPAAEMLVVPANPAMNKPAFEAGVSCGAGMSRLEYLHLPIVLSSCDKLETNEFEVMATESRLGTGVRPLLAELLRK